MLFSIMKLVTVSDILSGIRSEECPLTMHTLFLYIEREILLSYVRQ